MRIVAVADTHTFQDDLGPIPDGDVFVHAGDLCRRGDLDEMAGVAAWITGLPHRHKVVVAGNHDWCFVNSPTAAASLFEGCHYLEDSGVTIEGIRFWGSPWQPAYNDWAFNLPRGEALAEKWSLIPSDTDVLITHGPPEGYGDKVSIAGRSGCADLLDAARRVSPRLHMFGHIHQDGGFWVEDTIGFANVTTWECERAPSVFDVNTETKAVTAVLVPPNGT